MCASLGLIEDISHNVPHTSTSTPSAHDTCVWFSVVQVSTLSYLCALTDCLNYSINVYEKGDILSIVSTAGQIS